MDSQMTFFRKHAAPRRGLKCSDGGKRKQLCEDSYAIKGGSGTACTKEKEGRARKRANRGKEKPPDTFGANHRILIEERNARRASDRKEKKRCLLEGPTQRTRKPPDPQEEEKDGRGQRGGRLPEAVIRRGKEVCSPPKRTRRGKEGGNLGQARPIKRKWRKSAVRRVPFRHSPR